MKTKRDSVHKFKGKTHYGDKRDCIICHRIAPGVIGQKTGGSW